MVKEYPEYICKTLQDVQTATGNLDKASLVPLKINDGGVIKDVDNFVGVYNISQGKMCASVIPQYNLVQHKEYFDGFAHALNRLNINFIMTITQVGNRAFADIDFPDNQIKLNEVGEKFTSGIRLINSYDKSTGLFVIPRFTRLECSNGMVLVGNEKTLSVKHHTKLVAEIESFIEKKVNEVINMHDDLKALVNGCMKDSIEWKITCKIIEKLFKQIKHREEILKRLNIGVVEVKDKKTKKKTVSYVWNDNQAKKEKFTRWEIYNAVTQYLTHGEQITPHIENLFQKRAEKILVTPLAKMPRAEGI
jgi:hypothetical protein